MTNPESGRDPGELLSSADDGDSVASAGSVTAGRQPIESEGARILTLVGLTGIAIAQPLLAAFGENPGYFHFINARRSDIVVFAVVVALVPPLVLSGVGVLVRLAGESARALLQLVLVGCLIYMFVVQLAVSLPGAGALALGVCAGAVVAVLYHRFATVRMWTRPLAVVPALAVASFLFFSPTADLFDDDDLEAVASDDILLSSADDVAPVVFLVLDELSTRAILNDELEIDAARFPHLARLASQSTWYRDNSTVAALTQEALPALLTGRVPRDVPPLKSEHPENIFSLFGQTHHLTVSETFTGLCSRSECGFSPIPPPAPGDEDGETPIGAGEGFAAAELWDRTVAVLFDRVTPLTEEPAGGFDDFEESFVESPASDDEVESPASDEEPASFNAIQEFWSANPPRSRPSRFVEFVDAIGPSEVPTFYFLHLVLPHFPWQWYPDGTAYALPSDVSPLWFDTFRDDPWLLDINRTRMTLQAQYTDSLVGLLLDRLDDADIYDDAVVVVVSDHGISFELGERPRDLDGPGASDVIYAPLLIKEPGQTTSAVSSLNSNILDVMPTIAAAAGVNVPWSVDGVDLRSPAAEERGDTKTVYRFQNEITSKPTAVIDIDRKILEAELERPGLPSAALDSSDPLTELYEELGVVDLYGESFSASSSAGDEEVRVQDLGRLESPAIDGPPLGLATGLVDQRLVEDEPVIVLSVDDRIVGFSPMIVGFSDSPTFVVLIPPDVLIPGSSHRIEIGLLTAERGLVSMQVRDAG